LGLLNIECPNCHALHWKAEHLVKSPQANPLFGKCCLSGKVDLPILKDVPQPLQSLLKDQTQDAKSFRKEIHQYNAALAFTSVGTNIVHLQGQGPQIFKVHDSVYHYQDSLLPKDTPNAQRKYAQLYIHNPQEAL
jgi:hypothetical protein